MRIFLIQIFLGAAFCFTAGCGSDGDAKIDTCEPEGSCSCEEGTERETRCVCEGGSDCSIEGDSIEFECDGNAACGLKCGSDCLITCPGTTSCTVEVGDDAVVSCPGTASCDIRCLADCDVEVAGAASAVIECVGEADGATCSVTGCSPTDCGDGVLACGRSCP